MFTIIAAIGQNRELGLGDDLCFHLKNDLRHFQNTTQGHPVVMGRKTWNSLPTKLKNRQNIVISRHPELIAPKHPTSTPKPLESPQNAPKPQIPSEKPVQNPDSEPKDDYLAPDLIISDLETFISNHQNAPEMFFIIGGAAIYQAFLPVAKTLILTEIAATPEADVYFPEVDMSTFKRKILQKGVENGLNYTIAQYDRP